MNNPVAIIAAVLSILTLLVAIGMLLSLKRWWPMTFAFTTLASSVILLSEFSSAEANTILVPVYIIVLCVSLMLLAITMVCGSITTGRAGYLGSVSVIVIGYALIMILIMPFIFRAYRMFLGIASVLSLGIVFGGTLSGLYSFFGRESVVSRRRYGSQTASHLLYYLSMAAITAASTNCTSIDEFASLLNVGVLASSVATIGIVIESAAWRPMA